MKQCFYAIGGINYKNGTVSCCPRQADQLVFQKDTFLPSEIYNHENFKELRRKLHNDEWPKGCDTCESMEAVGVPSMRQDFTLEKNGSFYKDQGKPPKDANIYTVQFYEKFHKEHCPDEHLLIKCYDPKTHYVRNEGLRHIELRFSNACNFACIHCSKVFSSGWSKKLQNFIPDKETHLYDLKQLLGTEHRHNDEDDYEMSLTVPQALQIVDDLNENFPYLEHINFAGGELLYQKQFLPVLKKLADHPNASNIHLSFHSNFNSDFDVVKLSELLLPFNTSTITISVDAGRTFYSYFRNGGTWDQLEKNIKKFREYNDYTWLDITCTTSIYQMLDIYDVFESFISLQASVNISIVQSPKYLDPSLILLDFEKETMKDIEKTEELIKSYFDKPIDRVSEKTGQMYWVKHEQTLEKLHRIVKYIKSFKPRYHEYNRFLIYRKKSDMIWNQNFNDYFQNYQIDEHNELVRVK